MGKASGVCGGKGGSQHLCTDGFYSNGVLGGTVPVATGMALAERERGTGAVTVVFIGDGTLGQGVVYESLNIASLWSLPLLFVVENNHYAQSTPSRLTLAGDIADRGAAFGIETAELDTTDVAEIEPRPRDDRRPGADEGGRSSSSSTPTASARTRRATTTATRRRSRRRAARSARGRGLAARRGRARPRSRRPCERRLTRGDRRRRRVSTGHARGGGWKSAASRPSTTR